MPYCIIHEPNLSFVSLKTNKRSTNKRGPIPQPEIVVFLEWALSWFDLSNFLTLLVFPKFLHMSTATDIQ